MAAKIVPINREIHKNTKILPVTNYSFVASQQLLPLVAHEIPSAAAEFPVVFVKDAQTSRLRPAAMCGLKPGENLYSVGKKWAGIYAPSIIKNHPLSVALKAEGSDEILICIDENSAQISDSEGHPLFNEDGSESSYVKETGERLVTLNAQSKATDEFVNYLVENELLMAKGISVSVDEDNDFDLNGLYLIDENKLNKIGSDEFEFIRKKGYLPLIYAHLISLNQVNRLVRMKHEMVSA